jgi:TolB protein
MNRQILIWPLVLILAISTFILLSQPGTGAAQGDTPSGGLPGAIAYSTGSELRLINADGSDDRLLWSSPYPTENGIANVEWRNDGSEIAFISNHESSASIYERDIYAIRPDGSGYRKLTNAPVQEALGGYPTGTVTVDVQVASGGGGPYLIYVSGAAAPQTLTAGTAGTWTLTFHNVADFGATQQPVVAIDGAYRWFNAATADVKAGQSVHAGTLTISGDGFWHFGVHENKLTWRSDDSALGFVFGAGCQLRQTSVQPGPGLQDEPLIEPAVFGTTCLVDWAPVASRANQLLYTENDYISGQGHIYLTAENSNAAGDVIINFSLPALVLDLEWLPDGSGFLFSITDSATSNANIYAYTWGASTVTPLTTFSNEYAAQFSISPDGQHVVFERASNPEGPVDLWLMGIDGSNKRLLLQDAARPSWASPSGTPPPPPPGSAHLYLPFLQIH